jgi:hypothetical protein
MTGAYSIRFKISTASTAGLTALGQKLSGGMLHLYQHVSRNTKIILQVLDRQKTDE